MEFIPAKQKEKLFEDTGTKRVCAYCRVSTDDVNQTSSYELQKNHYEDMIKEHQGWELVGIYADEGISGTSLQHRDEFNQMIEDCKAGKIDLIVTKSVSRFARNIVDCIAKVRELANMRPQVGVFFETEHIYTLDNTSEMMLAVLSAAAQEESHTKSEIMNISIEQRFSRGIFLTPKLLGYDIGEDGNLVINEEEAETVRLCYYLFLNGFPTAEIADILTQLKRKRKSRKMSNKLFSAMVYDMMGWDTDCRYKILGHKITHEDETMYIFDLLETEIFMDTKRKKKVKTVSSEKETTVSTSTDQTPEQRQDEIAAKVARKLNRIPFYPKGWKDSFGLPVEEHKKALETNLTDGYIEFSSTR